MKGQRKNRNKNNAEKQAEFLSMTLESMDPALLTKMAETNPDLITSMLQSLDAKALTEAVNYNPELFARMFRSMPRELLRRILEENREVVCEMVRRLDTDLLMEMMDARTSMIKSGAKMDDMNIQNGSNNKTPKLLLTLYQRKGRDVTKAGAPSPFSTLRSRQKSA